MEAVSRTLSILVAASTSRNTPGSVVHWEGSFRGLEGHEGLPGLLAGACEREWLVVMRLPNVESASVLVGWFGKA